MIGETNINGGAGLNGKGALLKIKAKTGSTITVSKGSYSKTIKVSQLDPDNNFWSYWLFQTTDFGEWTVTATATLDTGSETATDTVIIDGNKQYSVELIYNLWLIKNNQLVLPVTTTTYANVSQTDNGYMVKHNGSGAAYRGTAYWQLTDSVLGGKTFAKLLLDVNEWTGVANNDYSGFGLVKDYSMAGGTVLAFMKAYGNDLTKTLTLDISAYSLVNNYVSIRASESSHYVLIRNLYLSR